MPKIIELSTERLRLRQWRASDTEAFALMSSDPRVMEYLLGPMDAVASFAMQERLTQLISDRGWGFWAMELKETQQFIGFTGLHTPIPELPFSPCIEIGWRLAFDHWGKGYASEAAKAALDFGFNTLQLNEIVSFTALPNLRSQAVMQKLGMQRDAQTFMHPKVAEGHLLQEHCLYRLSKPLNAK
ncbi:GNAT family N-acetyltransferase [Janthinobacterium sp. B9-8]|uniref:GNAT family N-acetyltransferase n=1 Tax=Janthinobacterium sp. B9-8 TaxID=1236179 RepID=UPI00061D0E79|nr:GNAT family N-acetyltransferase [Janthinobacterium sp. B9-8]AMC36777.1 GCN5 family acetyltransferase [Janthinobacterium sp. B9-8]